MATSKDKAKERELRRLKRENVREQEASARQREEFRAVQAQKENYEIMLRRKEEQLKQMWCQDLDFHDKVIVERV